jgi:hypothetical protein
MGKGSTRRRENYQKFCDNFDEIKWSNRKKEFDIEDDKCYICGSKPGKPTSFKHFCSRCGNRD